MKIYVLTLDDKEEQLDASDRGMFAFTGKEKAMEFAQLYNDDVYTYTQPDAPRPTLVFNPITGLSGMWYSQDQILVFYISELEIDVDFETWKNQLD